MKLLAFVDGSVYSASVCDHAAWLAELNAPATVQAMHMLGRRGRQSVPSDLSGSLKLGARSDLLTKLADADVEYAQLAQARGRAILEDVAARIGGRPGVTVETRLRNDDLSEVVAGQDADVVVIGKRGEASGYAREHLGSNLERVLRGSDKPVLVANWEFRPIERCLIAYDGGPSIAKAIRYLSGAAAGAYSGIAFDIVAAGTETPELRAELEGVAASLRKAGLTADWAIRPGEAERVIPDEARARDSGLIVMGAYGHSRIRSLIIGSTTTSLIRSCRLPILMFR